MNKGNIDKDKANKKQKENYQETHPTIGKIFGRLLRNRINKMNIYGVKAKDLIQYYQILGAPNLRDYLTLKGLK